ncbi:hypothetical protein BANRA_04299 [Escherichia coli]|nr:hypothetical protein BANRA_04299 [Escherichia coli]
MKLTEESLNLVIDILNDLICEGKMLNDVSADLCSMQLWQLQR